MLQKSCLFIVLLSIGCQLMAQPSKCNRTLRYDYLKPKLDPSICIPPGNQIINIHDVDLNGDGSIDKIVRWQNAMVADGDTVHYSIYLRNRDGKFSFCKILSNLKPLYFFQYGSKSGNRFYDSLKKKYIYPSKSVVEFETNNIAITFYVKPAVIKRLSFTYAAEKDTWVLTREIQWAAPTQYKSDRRLEFDRAPNKLVRVEDFSMLDYIGK